MVGNSEFGIFCDVDLDFSNSHRCGFRIADLYQIPAKSALKIAYGFLNIYKKNVGLSYLSYLVLTELILDTPSVLTGRKIN